MQSKPRTKNPREVRFNLKNPSIYFHGSEEYILTTRDKMALELRDFRDAERKEIEGNNCFDKFMLFASWLFFLVTSDFKNFMNVPANVWQALSFVLAIVTFFYFIKSLCWRPKSNPQRIEELLNKLCTIKLE
jgi:hypothetical protein